MTNLTRDVAEEVSVFHKGEQATMPEKVEIDGTVELMLQDDLATYSVRWKRPGSERWL